MNGDGGGFIERIATFLGLRGASTESTIQEQYHDPIALHHTLAIRRWMGAILGNVSTVGGILLAGIPLRHSNAVDSFFSAVFLCLLAGIAMMMWFASVELSLIEETRTVRRSAEMLGDALILAALLFLAIYAKGQIEWWYGYCILIGVSIIVPSIFLSYNQSRGQVDPMGWTSPFERAMLVLLKKVLGAEVDQPQIVERPVIPWRHALARNVTRRQTEKEGVIEIPATDDLNLADFLEEAVKRGLGRAAWLKKGQPRYILPTNKESVTRGTYDRMIAMGVRYGYFEPGGDGDATGWTMEPMVAYLDWADKVQREWPGVLVPEEGEDD